ncbi:restriction endonuclease subunit S [Haemophilus influenzae]|uniref:Type I restriction modification DNA specificity domain protein n=1 Tax=Haemophilus influenzae (strain PittGG) TaxID=374931 RepID=A5UFR1_HAEIG|nr:restriction endonuclease subunit S [Haemophilus influenzae]ABQ99616.1 type I restriction modification DNA specificity domain protein [Haemophilus influenzae PittGG]MCK8789489.1 restriction endonuclease subunit S [Haemophilus influenzae]MCK8864034.1 restriction endonuclease subunit S [Haemophilus influenzae]MCK8946533.1 restriction endonuclease subunit S [Haemophilus influenzae]MCK9060731.1 restriction endonuclease subunit S [Haemophilus influenzae]
MRRYESYKDSGVEWLGEVPSHWNLIPNKYIFKLRKNVVGKRSSEYDLLSLSLKGVIKRDMENPEGKFPAEFDTYQEVKEGDFIFCLFDVEETPRTVGLSSYHGMITGAYTIFETNNVDKKFIYYFYLNLDSDKRLKPLYKGLRNTISKETFFSFNTFIPPLSEQQKIAQFLDDKTAKIDQAVDLAEKQIALLKEHKQILIQNSVTRGLNPDVPLKDSGVEWIGQVPEHWEILSIKRLSQVKRGASPRPIDNPKYFDNDGEYAWVRISDVTASNMYLLETTQKLSNLGKSYSVPLMPGSLFLSIAGSVGKPIITKIKVCIHDGFVYFPENKQNTKFLYYIFYSEQPYIGLGKMGTQLNLNTDTVGAIKIPIPPLCEQQKIADYLDTQTAKIDQAIALKTAHIEKLKEYKSVLINDVVTGKVRVSV